MNSDARVSISHIGGVKRTIICCNALDWLQGIDDNSLPGSVFTSLPDISELPLLFRGTIDEKCEKYKAWFMDVAELIMNKLAVGEYAIFLQSDVRVQGLHGIHTQWLDKSYLCSAAAEKANCTMMWHKLVSCSNMEKRSISRPTYSHLLCYGKSCSYPSGAFATPDIFDRGDMVWVKGVGFDCCLMGIAFLKEVANTSCIIDPFCGHGTVLAMANTLGIDSIGVEISLRRCKKSMSLRLDERLDAMPLSRRRQMGLMNQGPYHSVSKMVPSDERLAESADISCLAIRDDIAEERLEYFADVDHEKVVSASDGLENSSDSSEMAPTVLEHCSLGDISHANGCKESCVLEAVVAGDLDEEDGPG